jgi:Restriction endonuclease
VETPNLRELIVQTDSILALATTIQDENLELEKRQDNLKSLEIIYHNWYYAASALFNLYNQPGDRLKFMAEYEGSIWFPKVHKFILAGLQPSVFYDPEKPNQLIPKWNYPFERAFKEPFLKQKHLLGAFEVHIALTELSEKQKQEWNEVICRILKIFIDKADSANSNAEKKFTYEYLAMFLIGAIEGLAVISHDLRSPAEEVDLLIANESKENLWISIGNPFIVECKNWTSSVGVPQVRNLLGVMDSKNIGSAILLCKNGITGDSTHDAKLLVREARAKNKFLIVLDQVDLLEIASGMHPNEKIKQKFYEIYKL